MASSITLYGAFFYLSGLLVVISTALAITRRNLVHAVVYLTISFFASAVLFYLLGAPFLAVLEVIIYAGAIMVLFLFIIMMIKVDAPEKGWGGSPGQWLPAVILAGACLALTVTLLAVNPAHRMSLPPTLAEPREFGRFLFQEYWLPVEIVSFLLFVALVGALYLGRRGK